MSDPTAETRLEPCGCCEAGPPEAPAHDNRPGLPALRYRVGTHGSFMRRMLARLAVELPDLTSRAGDDPAIAMLDAWATAADVLSFYSERMANEHYLRTAAERRSVLELARAIGYELSPGVAAGVELAFTLDEFPGSTPQTSIPSGTRVQSVPAPGEQPQSFETVEAIEARVKWNAMRPRQTRPQRLAIGASGDHLYRFALPGEPPLSGPGVTAIAVADLFRISEVALDDEVDTLQAQGVNAIVIAGANLRLAPGDRLLFVGVRGGETRALVAPVLAVEPDQKRGETRVSLDLPLPPQILFVTAALIQLAQTALPPGPAPLPLGGPQVHGLLANRVLAESQLQAIVATNQWASGSFELLLERPPPPPAAVFAFAERLGFFGHNGPYYRSLPQELRLPPGAGGFVPPEGAPPTAVYPTNWDGIPGVSEPLSIWEDSLATGSDTTYDAHSADAPDAYLGRAVPAVIPGSWVVFEDGDVRRAYRVRAAAERSLVGFGIHDRVTGLALDDVDGTDLVNDTPDKPDSLGFRTATAHVASAQLELAELPITDVVPQGATELMLEALALDLPPGRRAMLTGEQAGAPGIFASELLTLEESTHLILEEPGGVAGFTTLRFAPGLQRSYLRASVTINANVARATHGETVQHVLGSGDGAQANQRFALRKSPLTYVSAQTPSGAESALEVRVEGVRWDEAPSLFGLGPETPGLKQYFLESAKG
ncbi:MAG: hypothetical protein HGA45_35960 [Chloroflexales bacterium]|nr:hypothetical protein [Chloroflexales bacterium]